MNTRLRWLLPALAALAVLALISTGALAQRPTAAPPAGTATASASASGQVSPSGAAPTSPHEGIIQVKWVKRGPAPRDLYEFVEHKASVGAHDYFFRTRDCRVQGYRHDTASDTWHALPPGPRRLGASCELYQVIAHGSDLYAVFDAPRGGTAALAAFDTRTRTWTELPWAGGVLHGQVAGLDTGILVWLHTGSRPLDYHFFSYTSGTWRTGSFDPGVQANQSDSVEPVTVAGRPLLLLTSWPNSDLPGTVTFTTFDPLTGEIVVQASRELSFDAMQAASQNEQVAAPGIVYVGPSTYQSTARQGALLDLLTGEWSTLQLPVQAGDPYSVADWVFPFFGAEAAPYVEANGFLYEPATQQWFAVPDAGVAPPDLESDEQVFFPAGPRQMCSTVRPGTCLAPDVGSPAQLRRPLEGSELPRPR